jgi:hypothetical protein
MSVDVFGHGGLGHIMAMMNMVHIQVYGVSAIITGLV